MSDINQSCSITGCTNLGSLIKGRRYFTKSMCSKHYSRQLRHGTQSPTRVFDGRRKHELYTTYTNMKQRCYKVNNPSYPYYGGRGIKMCDKWMGVDGFTNFIADMGKRPTSKHTVDRIDVDGDYEPSNCRWATRFIQAANTRRNNKVVGVSFNKRTKLWTASMYLNKRRVLLKSFRLMNEAIKARRATESKYGVFV